MSIRFKNHIIEENYNCKEGSFMFYLHERDEFDTEELMKLCDSIEKNTEKNDIITNQLFCIQSQILRHIIYHFDSNDLSQIKNLPDNYMEYIELLEDAINKYFMRKRKL